MESYPIGPDKRFVRYKFSEGGPLTACFVALLSFGFFVFGLNHLAWQHRFAATTLPARGVITAVEIGDNDGTRMYTPTVRYIPANERDPVTFKSRMSTSTFCREGETVAVLYPPDNVFDAELESNVRSPWFAWGFVGIGAICALLFASVARSMVVGYETSDADD